MKVTTWATYLKNHKDREDYNKAAVEVAEVINQKYDKTKVFLRLVKEQLIVIAMKSGVDGVAQYLFKFFKLGNSILKQGMKCAVMIGFGKISTTVSVDPKSLFKLLTT